MPKTRIHLDSDISRQLKILCEYLETGREAYVAGLITREFRTLRLSDERRWKAPEAMPLPTPVPDYDRRTR